MTLFKQQNHPIKPWGWQRLKSKGIHLIFGKYDALNWKIFETLFALSWLFWLLGYLPTVRYWLSDAGFHISAANASAHYADPAPLLPAAWVTPVVTIYLLCVALYIFGIWRKTLIWVLFWGAVYTQAVDQPSAFTLSKLFIVYFFLIGISPTAKQTYPAHHKKPFTMTAWPIRIIQLTLIIQYFTAGTCKIFWGDWIFTYHNEKLGFSAMNPLWGFTQGIYKNTFAAWLLNILSWRPFWVIFSLSAVLFEFFAPILFIWRKTRYRIAVLYGISMHIGIALLMKDLVYFSVQMISLYIFWVRPEHCRNILRGLRDFLLPPSWAARFPISRALPPTKEISS